ncbi:MAG: hypothetical protein QM811_21415 [Pirellulales bacterium]
MSRVVAVGNCGYDQGTLNGWLSRDFATSCVAAHDWEDLQAELRRGDVALVLVNRILDRDGSEGLDILTRLKAEPRFADVPAMLLSNYADAQATAVALVPSKVSANAKCAANTRPSCCDRIWNTCRSRTRRTKRIC